MRAPAKINLYLAVGTTRRDGYHELTTVFHAVGLYDEVTVQRAEVLSVTVAGEGADRVPTDGGNLAARAATLLGMSTGHDPRVAIEISKSIPVAAGCAGGSADAAAALLACDALWGTGLAREELLDLGARLGSDVPFALHGGTALGTGRGERLTPVLAHGDYAWVLALPSGELSTPEVYAELDRRRAAGHEPLGASDLADVLAALRAGDPAALGAALRNDLQPVALALQPQLRQVLRAGAELGALGAVVSGSGPTVAFLTQDADRAVDFAAALAGHGVCRSVRHVSGPVPGARVVAVD